MFIAQGSKEEYMDECHVLLNKQLASERYNSYELIYHDIVFLILLSTVCAESDWKMSTIQHLLNWKMITHIFESELLLSMSSVKI